MKTVIDSISEPHGSYPGSVDVSFHIEIDGRRDGFERKRIALTENAVKEDGSYDEANIEAQVRCAIWNMNFREAMNAILDNLPEAERAMVLAAPEGLTNAGIVARAHKMADEMFA